MTESDRKDLAQRKAVGGPVVGDIYRHYKGGFYVVVARSVMEDTLVPLVTYRSNAKGTVWTRTVENFTEWTYVTLPGEPERFVERFRRELG